MSFAALYLSRTEDGTFTARLRDDLSDAELVAHTGDAGVVVRAQGQAANAQPGRQQPVGMQAQQ